MITWAEKVAFVGMTVEKVYESETDRYNQAKGTWYNYRVKVSIPGGYCSLGEARKFDDAIGDAALSFQIDWSSVERKITDKTWESMSHT